MDLSTNYQNIACPDINVQGKVKRQYLNLNIVVSFYSCLFQLFYRNFQDYFLLLRRLLLLR